MSVMLLTLIILAFGCQYRLLRRFLMDDVMVLSLYGTTINEYDYGQRRSRHLQGSAGDDRSDGGPRPSSITLPQLTRSDSGNVDAPRPPSAASIRITAPSSSSSSSARNMTPARTTMTDHPPPPPPARRRWAYAFLVAGCGEKNPGYKGFLYNVAVSAQQLRDFGTAADVVVFVQMATSADGHRLPPGEERMLLDVDVRIRYLPRFRSSVHECFYATVMEKFRILELVEYSRVLFLDADIMPLRSLDYLFELSEPEQHDDDGTGGGGSVKPLLKENVIVAWNDEGANAGLFMMRPSLDNWESLQRAIRVKEERALQLGWPHWDEVEGWGRKITPPDYWRGTNGTKLTAWNWHAVFADQGLVYYWPKYVQKNVSIIVGREVETWSSTGGGGDVYLEAILKNPLVRYFNSSGFGHRPPPLNHIVHFTGRRKPWTYDLRNVSTGAHNGRNLLIWRQALVKAQTRTNYSFSLFLKNDHNNAAPPVGSFSTYNSMIHHIKLKKFWKWNPYEDPDDIDIW
jgi:hypothetical protein